MLGYGCGRDGIYLPNNTHLHSEKRFYAFDEDVDDLDVNLLNPVGVGGTGCAHSTMGFL